MSDYIHMRHGDDTQNKELLKLLNRSFTFDENENFETLLPKLYKDKYHPAQNNVILDVNGEMRAAVGLYYNKLTVGDEVLSVAGIGNVACAPEHRQNGYMQFCMAVCLDEMKQKMVDISWLGGARQRYEHFSYEPAGVQYTFTYTKDNVRRTLGTGRKSKYTAKLLTENDTDILEKICERYNSYSYRFERKPDNIFDILKSWNAIPYAAFEEDELRGWFVPGSDRAYIHEIGYFDNAYIEDILLLTLETCGNNEIRLNVPPFNKELSEYLGVNCEHYNVTHPEQFTVLCFENVIRAFLKLKASTQGLPDGELTVFIEGEKLPEQLKITVKDNVVTVEETTEKPQIVLRHLEAMRLFCSLYSEKRNQLDASVRSWFPLPLFSYSLDNV